MSPPRADADTLSSLLRAATALMLANGYCATTVDDVCDLAGRSKGSFFHYFANKESLAAAVLQGWLEGGAAAYRDAPFWRLRDPVRRFIGYVNYTEALLAAASTKAC